tara:strand:+ start:1404 stop:2639 length:1236 start_codon:yes stop_codon:yes gene_type:complete
MADYTKFDGVAEADIVKVNGVAKASIVNIDGATKPSAGATMWAMSSTDMYISWVNAADVADVTKWEDNVYRLENSSADTFDIAYGLDASNGAKWMTVNNSNADEIKFDGNNDITDESTWSTHNIHADYGNAKQETIQYTGGDGETDDSSGSDVTRVGCWISTGRTSTSNVFIHRSVDGGANWTHLNLDGLPGITGSSGDSDYHIRALAGDGTGNWMLAQRGNLYYSSDSGVSFSYLHQPTGIVTDLIRDIVYTNSTWVALLSSSVSGTAMLYSCAASTKANMDAASDWGMQQLSESVSGSLTPSTLRRMAGAGGRVVAVNTAQALAADVNGKTITIQGNRQTIDDEGSINTVATDGTTWLIGSDGGSSGPDGGDINRSTDGGLSWTKIVEGINKSGDRKVEGLAPNVVLPL